MENTEYKPTRREILRELVKPIKEKTKKIGKHVKDSFRDNLYLYAIPTLIRKGGFKTNSISLGTILAGTQVAEYAKLADKDIPAYWLPIATNVLSGIYETGRYFYKKTEEKLINSKLEKELKGGLK